MDDFELYSSFTDELEQWFSEYISDLSHCENDVQFDPDTVTVTATLTVFTEDAMDVVCELNAAKEEFIQHIAALLPQLKVKLSIRYPDGWDYAFVEEDEDTMACADGCEDIISDVWEDESTEDIDSPELQYLEEGLTISEDDDEGFADILGEEDLSEESEDEGYGSSIEFTSDSEFDDLDDYSPDEDDQRAFDREELWEAFKDDDDA